MDHADAEHFNTMNSHQQDFKRTRSMPSSFSHIAAETRQATGHLQSVRLSSVLLSPPLRLERDIVRTTIPALCAVRRSHAACVTVRLTAAAYARTRLHRRSYVLSRLSPWIRGLVSARLAKSGSGAAKSRETSSVRPSGTNGGLGSHDSSSFSSVVRKKQNAVSKLS